MSNPRKAANLGVSVCECCDSVTFHLFDKQGRAFATAELDEAEIAELTIKLMGHLGMITDEGDEAQRLDA
jgi:hypothetical protein